MSKRLKASVIILVVCIAAFIPRLIDICMPEGRFNSSGIDNHNKEANELLEIIERNDVAADDELTEDKTEDELTIKTPEDEVVFEDTTESAEEYDVYTEAEDNNSSICSLMVICEDVLNNIDKLKKSKRATIPENGIFVNEENIEIKEGESVFDILYRTLRKNKVQFDYTNSPVNNSVYIKGIGNLYEFDCGGNSGWLYRVNGEKPSYGASKYIVQAGDKIEFYYAVNYLKDK